MSSCRMPFRFRSITFRIIVSSKFKSSSRSFLSSTRRRPKIPQGPVPEQTEAGRRNLARGARRGRHRNCPVCAERLQHAAVAGGTRRRYLARVPRAQAGQERDHARRSGGVLQPNRSGDFLCFLDLCLQRRHIRYEAKLHADPGSDGEKTLAAVYKWKQD